MKIQKDVRDKIVEHARRQVPVEACGYLGAKDGIVCRHYELTNVDQSPEHFSFDPKEQFDTVRDARSRGLEICAVYHSHPATPARPSAEDIRLAYDPSISYVIISLAGGREDVKSFKIAGAEAAPEPVEVV